MNAPMQLPFADDRQRQEALVAHLVAAGYLRCEPPMLQPAAAFLRVGRGHARAVVPHAGHRRGRAVPAPRVHDPSLPGLHRLGRFRASCRLFLLRSGVPPAPRRAGRIRAGGHRKLRPARPRGGGCRDSRALAGRGGALHAGPAGDDDRRRGAVRRPARCPGHPDAMAPGASSAASPRARASPASSIRRATAASTIPACSRRWKASTRRARGRWSRTCWRSPASPPSAAARRARSPTASSSRRR